MTPDYLDLLLDRATGALPLAEPRIAPSTFAASFEPVWEEITDETFQTQAAQAAQPGTQPETHLLRGMMQGHKAFPVASRAVAEESRNPETPPTLHVSEQRTAVPQSLATGSPPHSTHHATAPNPNDLLTAPSQVAPSREERVSKPDAVSPNSAMRTAATRAEMPPSSILPERTIERTTQTQRLFPAPPATDFAAKGDRLTNTSSSPNQSPQPAPISIRIDRIEVRAGGSTPSSITPPKPRPSAPLGLDEYLKRKSGGDR